MQYVLGVDGGGTHTRVALASLEGELLARAKSGPGHPGLLGSEQVRDHLLEARAFALRAAGLEARPARAACVGLAGAGSAEVRTELRRLLAEAGVARFEQLEVVPDFTVAHAGAFAGRPGVVVIVGTGSVVYGRDAGGREARAGGRGPEQGDPLSASWIAGEWARLGGGEAAPVDGEGSPGACAPHVTRAAERDDALARSILERGARELADQVASVASQLEVADPEVALVGGVMEAGPFVETILAGALAAVLPEHRRRAPLLPPVAGALLQARSTESGTALHECNVPEGGFSTSGGAAIVEEGA